MKPLCALALWVACLPCPSLGADASPETGRWDFTVTLDGKPVGTHRFVIEGNAQARRVESRASFVVRLLGIPVYRYRHEADERWQGDCLRQLRADTDDDGQRRTVDQAFDQDCLMAFAYWNPRVVQQQRLVDPQTGEPAPVRFERLPDAQIAHRGQSVPARGWRLQTREQRIGIWYAADTGRWIALDADLAGGRRLAYRLTPNPGTP